MERDFTESLQQAMLGMVDTYETWLCLQDTEEEFEAYQEYWDNWNDMVYAMNHLEAHRQYMIEQMGYDADAINEIFTDVREYDNTYPETIAANASTFFDAYIETLNGLLEAITVKDGNSPYTTTEMYAMSAREQYGRWGSMSSGYGGLLNNCGLFSQQIQNAGGGIVQECYESIRDVDGAGFQALMDKSIEDIKPWEVAALSLVFEDCVGEDGQIDYEKLEDLINRCYQVNETRTGHFNNYLDIMEYTVEVDMSLSPVMGLLDDYMTAQANYDANLYENTNTRLTYNMSLRDVQNACYLSDVVYSLNEYYSSNTYVEELNEFQQLDPYPRVSLSVNDSGNILTVSFDRMDDVVTIYRFTDDYMQEVYSANSDVAASGLLDPNQQLIVNSANFIKDKVSGLVMDEIVDHIPVVGTLNSLYELGSDLYGIYDSYNETVENNAEIYRVMNNQELLSVMYATDCSASIVQCGDRCDVRNVAFDTSDVICQTALYNQSIQGNYGDENTNLGQPIESYQVVEEEFYQYMSGQKPLSECTSLQALIDFDRGNAVYEAGEYSAYLADVEEALEADLGVDNIHPNDAYSEQLLAVVDEAAVNWLEDEKGKYEEQNNN
ncbi:MAG: hypothetical protein E7257_03525 [Lachnospiraceae bacterium]|nr:hypothetical protein [Lachnospiraceae bacterium]